MNKFKKILASVLGCAMLFSAGACSGHYEGEIVDDANDVLSGTLNIRLFEAGYGTAWLDNVAQAFNERYPDGTFANLGRSNGQNGQVRYNHARIGT